eukprot:scpid65491/ scgid33163/ 
MIGTNQASPNLRLHRNFPHVTWNSQVTAHVLSTTKDTLMCLGRQIPLNAHSQSDTSEHFRISSPLPSSSLNIAMYPVAYCGNAPWKSLTGHLLQHLQKLKDLV